MTLGVLAYFPDALMEVAHVSYLGNKQHHPDEPLHWDREKSTDQLDAGLRHLTDHVKGVVIDDDGGYHLAKSAWRILAELQLTIEKKRDFKTLSHEEIWKNEKKDNPLGICEVCDSEAVTVQGGISVCYKHYENRDK